MSQKSHTRGFEDVRGTIPCHVSGMGSKVSLLQCARTQSSLLTAYVHCMSKLLPSVSLYHNSSSMYGHSNEIKSFTCSTDYVPLAEEKTELRSQKSEYCYVI